MREEQVTLASGIRGVLCMPDNRVPDIAGRLHGRVHIIVHGQGGHRDYCHQKLLAHRLSDKESVCTFRFDFHGCGASDVLPFGSKGRFVDVHDQEDLDEVVDYLTRRRGLRLGALVGHSRGALASLIWAVRNQNRHRVLGLVNCSGRFRLAGTAERVRRIHSSFDEDGGYYLRARRHGEPTPVWISKEEVLHNSYEIPDVARLCSELDARTPVLSVYGRDDDHVPLDDAHSYARAFGARNTLEIVDHADHNMFPSPAAKAQLEEKNLPDTRAQTVDIIAQWLGPEAERARFLARFGRDRWRPVPGVNNVRDFGGYPTSDGTTVRAGLLFRGAHLGRVQKPEGSAALQQLGIKTIFDLRSASEVSSLPSIEVEGIERRWVPVFRDRDASPAAVAARNRKFRDPIDGFRHTYTEILHQGGPAYREILLHIRDRPDDGLLVHCTAGKDRTGVCAALILLLMGVDHDTVARDYELTTQGLEHELPLFMYIVERDVTEASGRPWTDRERNATRRLLSSTYDTAVMLVDLIASEYGSAAKYFRQVCGFTDADLAKIRSNLQEQGRGHL